ncbi:MAG: HypC/HybG/HupF family hydrogenase formation chaperone [Mycobacterium leprae]
MCLAIPAKIVAVNGRQATVDLSGNRRTVDVTLVAPVAVGQWVLMHAGVAIQVLDEAEAEETLALIAEAYGAAPEDGGDERA